MEAATVIKRSTLDHLPRLNQAVAILMAEEGLLAIIEDDAGQSFGATGA